MVQILENQGAVVELERTYAVSPDAVYRAWTDPAIVVTWLAPRPYRCEAAELDVRVGGSYRIAMHNPENGNSPCVAGVYEVVEPGARLVFTWKWESNASWQEESRVSVELLDAGGGTLLRLRHERLPDEKEREGHMKGWSACLEQLEEGF